VTSPADGQQPPPEMDGLSGGRPSTFFSKTVSGARSASQRYPRELWRSLLGSAGWSNASPDVQNALSNVVNSKFGAAWLGHASMLLRAGEELILTDPVLSDRIGPRIAGRSFGLGRLGASPVGPGDLPKVRTILLSHAHFDHLDRPTLMALASPDVTIITAAGTRDLVPRGFGKVLELPWGEKLTIGGVELCAMQPAHWGARTAIDRSRGYNSYVIESRSSDRRRILFGGDTAMTRAFDNLGVDLAIMGVGGYDPWEHAHATPEQVWTMVDRMRADRVLPMHHSTFPLSREPVGEPLERLDRAAGKAAGRIAMLKPGDSISD
jgi:L-ascorbate metabolism protein UlaG (beta-lactamase superfamily)